MRLFRVAIALVALGGVAFAGHVTPNCGFNYTNYTNENQNWDAVDRLLGPTGYDLLACGGTGAGPVGGPVDMLSVENFAMLAGSTITCTGVSDVDCDIGLDPGTSVTGFPVPCTQSAGQTHVNDVEAIQGKADLNTLFNDLNSRTSTGTISGDIGGSTFIPGVFTAASTVGITGTVTLDAGGNPNAVFIFQIGTALTTATSSVVALAGGAQADNVFWVCGSSCTLGISSVMNGNVLADQSITLNTSAVVNGRTLARVAAVTLDTNFINAPPSCVP